MGDVDLWSIKVKMMRSTTGYISPLGDETLWIKKYSLTKKLALTFATNLWWLLVRF